MNTNKIGAWEYFCDASYFDLWCVRRVGERTFGQGFHVASSIAAKELAEELARIDAESAETIEQLRTKLADAKAALLNLANDYRGYPHLMRADATEALVALTTGDQQ